MGIKIFKNGVDIRAILLLVGIFAVIGIAQAYPIIGDYITAKGFNDSDNTAYYLDPANTGTSALFAGKVGIGTASPDAKLDIRPTANNIALQLKNDDGTGQIPWRLGSYATFSYGLNFGTNTTNGILFLKTDGNVGINTITPITKFAVNGLTGSTGTAVIADSNGNFYLLSSSEKFKKNIKPYSTDFNKLSQIPIKTWKYTTANLTDNQATGIGFTAEDLHNAGLTNLINYDNESKPFSIKWDAVAIYQQGQINDLIRRIEILEATK